MTLVPLPVAMRAHLRARDLPRLRRSGPLGDLLAAQSVLHAEQRGFAELVRSHPALPGDLVNFHWDPVAAAVALGWSGAKMATRAIRVELEAGRLRFHVDRAGRPMNVLVELDAEAFGEAWLAAVERAQSRARSGLGDPGTP